MRTRLAAALAVAAALSACRDEQAGPRPHGQAQPQGQAPRPGPQGQQLVPTQPRTPNPTVLDAAPELTWKSGATWANGAVVYLGSTVDPQNPTPGQPVTLRHFFRADKEQPKGYHFFMHAIDASTQQVLGNMDHELQAGAAPLGSWPQGKIIEDRQQIQMPNYPGTIQFVFGFWTEGVQENEGRLVIDQADKQDGRQRVLGPKLEAPQMKLPEYHMAKATKPPIIDGKLDDAAWANALAAPLVGSFDGRPVTRKTTVRLTYDDQFVYVAFDCEDPDIWGTGRNKDDDIYNQEAVEVFFDADGDGATYNELQCSPHNVNFDASFVARRSDLEAAKKWESGMTTAVDVRGTLDDDKPDQGWSVEMKIPIANLNHVPHVPPQKGDMWRFNAYRLEHIVHHTQIEGQAFSPLFIGDFHHLPRFGKLYFE